MGVKEVDMDCGVRECGSSGERRARPTVRRVILVVERVQHKPLRGGAKGTRHEVPKVRVQTAHPEPSAQTVFSGEETRVGT